MHKPTRVLLRYKGVVWRCVVVLPGVLVTQMVVGRGAGALIMNIRTNKREGAKQGGFWSSARRRKPSG